MMILIQEISGCRALGKAIVEPVWFRFHAIMMRYPSGNGFLFSLRPHEISSYKICQIIIAGHCQLQRTLCIMRAKIDVSSNGFP